MKSQPFVSIIVPVYNDEEGIRETVKSLMAQTYPVDRHELIVVDNASTDDTFAVAERLTDGHRHATVLVERDVQSSYAARNTGIEASEGDILGFIDSDMTVSPMWLTDVVESMGTGVDALACAVELYVDGDESIVAEFNRRTDFPIERFVTELGFAPTCCLFVRRHVFDDIGRFDQRLISSGDLEFGNRLVDAGYDLMYADDIVMRHPARVSLEAILKKEHRLGHGKYQLSSLYPSRYQPPIRRLLNPLLILPPRLSDVRSEVRGWERVSPSKRAAMYAIRYLLNLSKATGLWHEYVRTLDDSFDSVRRDAHSAARRDGAR